MSVSEDAFIGAACAAQCLIARGSLHSGADSALSSAPPLSHEQLFPHSSPLPSAACICCCFPRRCRARWSSAVARCLATPASIFRSGGAPRFVSVGRIRAAAAALSPRVWTSARREFLHQQLSDISHCWSHCSAASGSRA